MGWTWKKEYLDVILVPSGLLIMFGYHFLLLHRHFRRPDTTSMGRDNFYRGAWVDKMMQVECKDRSQALTVINNNISAAFSLSSISMVVSSLIGTWFVGTSTFTSTLIYGDTSQSIIAFKHISLLICFLVAFAAFLQSARCYVHSSFLITMPNTDVPMAHVRKAVVSGSNCWSVGMRALYFAITLLLWVFGPIPMFVCSVVMVVMLYNLDWNTTPLLPYQPAVEGRDLLKKISQEVTAVGRAIGQEVTAVGRAFEHHGRP
ncbi:hypothetical protein RHMOL_Rhmol04G0039800 [Rhododendron molle]|uniref:Uncharacterized protein n=1 Tax=Rhododendron molle TaxID=49168 RepID=A0ACC0NX14_RHOML|nr:hypothetical protein RHMOL_Rhmol04G0039800 [Rhododendron molle]